MKLLLAGLKHETNTFSPIPASYERFFPPGNGIEHSSEALSLLRGTGTSIGGFIDVAEAEGAEIVIPLYANAKPCGPTDNATFNQLADVLVKACQDSSLDGILLDLHGAMVAGNYDDAEAELLRRIRDVNPNVPIGVALDMHANISEAFVSYATVVTGFHTYPHVDMRDAGRRCASIIIKTIKKQLSPVLVYGSVPLVPSIMCQSTFAGPNKALQRMCVELENSGTVLAASLFMGFHHADTPNTGVSAIVCTDEDKVAAQNHCKRLVEAAWSRRHEFRYVSTSISEALDKAQAVKERPVLLLDHCDSAGSGGPMDTTDVLEEMINRKLQNAVFYAILDPQAVWKCMAAGIGATVQLELGGKYDLSALGYENRPLTVSGVVRTLSDGTYTLHGPMLAGTAGPKGNTAVLDVDGLLVVIISTPIEPYDRNCVLSLGIDLAATEFLALKSRIHWRAGFGHLGGVHIECSGIGVNGPSPEKTKYTKLRRPIYPLDDL